MKILIHAQHLSGVGHEVRARELARALGEAHAVAQVDGGRAVPRPDQDGSIERIALPRIVRGPVGLAPLDAGRSVAEVMLERRERLRTEAARLAPDVLLVEHFPFSKWELEPEISAAIEAARAANPAALVVCSLRDVCPKTRHEGGAADAYAARVTAALRERFDALLIHTDPRFTRLEEHFPGASAIDVPVFYTGFVSERPRATRPGSDRPTTRGGFAVQSVGGGGAGSAGFALRCIEAWRRLHEAGATGGRTLVIFAGLFWSQEELAAVRAATAGGPFLLKPFGTDFLAWLAAADLSISRAGYNTCTNLLQTGCPALLVPDPGMSDQPFRAQRLAELGLAETLDPGQESADELADAIARGLRRPRARHDLDLDGARRTRRLLETLVAAGRDLLALARRRGVRLEALDEITTLRSPQRRGASFALGFADGSRLKGSRLASVERAEIVERLLRATQDGFARVVERRGDALALEWIEGPTLDALPAIPAHVLRRCGEMLGALCRLDGRGAEGRRRTPDEFSDRLRDGVDVLLRAGLLAPEIAALALEAAARSRPQEASIGVVHQDFCAQNIVLGTLGSPVCIDNASLELGPEDLALARTWWRWPMTPAERTHFEAGYEKHRSLATFRKHFAFWASCVLVGSAAWRLRMGVGAVDEPLGRLERLVASQAAGPR